MAPFLFSSVRGLTSFCTQKLNRVRLCAFQVFISTPNFKIMIVQTGKCWWSIEVPKKPSPNRVNGGGHLDLGCRDTFLEMVSLLKIIGPKGVKVHIFEKLFTLAFQKHQSHNHMYHREKVIATYTHFHDYSHKHRKEYHQKNWKPSILVPNCLTTLPLVLFTWWKDFLKIYQKCVGWGSQGFKL